MRKAPSIFLRKEIFPKGIDRMIVWMETPSVTEYMNEDSLVTHSLKQLVTTVPAPILTYRFNEYGRFFIICRDKNEPIGFIKFKQADKNVYEIVYAIGDESLWGRGYGKTAIKHALNEAFLFLRADKVVAKVDKRNTRSVRLINSCGFGHIRSDDKFHFYRISSDDFILKQK